MDDSVGGTDPPHYETSSMSVHTNTNRRAGKTLVIYFVFLQFNRQSIDYPGKSAGFIAPNLHSDSCQGTSSGFHRRLQKMQSLWSASGWAGFGGQVHHGLPRPCASLQPSTLPICRLWASADRGGGSFSIHSGSLKAQSLQELLPIPWWVGDGKQRWFNIFRWCLTWADTVIVIWAHSF